VKVVRAHVLKRPAAKPIAEPIADVDPAKCVKPAFPGVSAEQVEACNVVVASYLAQRGGVEDKKLRHRLYSKLFHQTGLPKATAVLMARCGASLWDRQVKVE